MSGRCTLFAFAFVHIPLITMRNFSIQRLGFLSVSLHFFRSFSARGKRFSSQATRYTLITHWKLCTHSTHKLISCWANLPFIREIEENTSNQLICGKLLLLREICACVKRMYSVHSRRYTISILNGIDLSTSSFHSLAVASFNLRLFSRSFRFFFLSFSLSILSSCLQHSKYIPFQCSKE